MKLAVFTEMPEYDDIEVRLVEPEYPSLGNFALKLGISNTVYLTLKEFLTLKYEVESALYEYEERQANATLSVVPADAPTLP